MFQKLLTSRITKMQVFKKMQVWNLTKNAMYISTKMGESIVQWFSNGRKYILYKSIQDVLK